MPLGKNPRDRASISDVQRLIEAAVGVNVSPVSPGLNVSLDRNRRPLCNFCIFKVVEPGAEGVTFVSTFPIDQVGDPWILPPEESWVVFAFFTPDSPPPWPEGWYAVAHG